jgi:hypothetical protein
MQIKELLDFVFSTRIPQSTDFQVAGATVRAPLGVERAAVHAAVIHLARKPIGDERAYN